MEKNVILQGAVFIFLLFLSGFFSSSETALLSIDKIKLKRLQEQKKKNAKLVAGLLKEPEAFLSAILIGNNIVNVGASALATAMALQLFENNAVGIATGVVTVLVLIFGEITPKTYAAQNAERVANLVAKPIHLLTIALKPAIYILSAITDFIMRLMGGQINYNRNIVTEEEIRLLVNVGHEEGLIEAEEREMIDSIFDFDDTIVREIMVPRVDMVAVEVDNDFNDTLETIIAAGHSRIPVFKETVDRIIGIIYAKDLLPYFKRDIKKPSITHLMRPPYFVPDTKKVNELLREMQEQKNHMAVVLDEYGGTAGIVTIEDILEEIVGEIRDEFDKLDEAFIRKIDNHTYIISGKANVEDLNDELKIKLPLEDYETLSGLIFSELGKVPEGGEVVELEGVKLIVEEVAEHRILKVRVEL
jgi:gliding motility-associated protein GldE